MTSHEDELSRNMDRITQLQDGIDNLVTIMYSTLSYLSRKADFKQVNPDVPITQAIPDPTKTDQTNETFTENCQELVADFIRKAKQLEYLISILPPHEPFSDVPQSNAVAQGTSNGHMNGHQAPQAANSSPVSSPPNHHRLGTISSSTGTDSDGLKATSPTAKPSIVDEVEEPPDHNRTIDDELGSDREDFLRLQREIEDAQAEYEHALSIAESLHQEIKNILRVVLEKRGQSSTWVS
ncbi:hypothetical protein CROQUDRAFT_662593 [Cronartium quercuum f. sp. fusiforme G11]|uniref:Mediator of RNA polymerase II transcription subunit 21 n=1 Tax=Cronartium quercuum f. sp. fusiforme G11 TaxID=708437 RepID=A0A9P6N9E8_9BASI|nr:hypothetical protein CROQUDRAFT_662593 [Cronartium quercuum f. sp. fusiforme G11]